MRSATLSAPLALTGFAAAAHYLLPTHTVPNPTTPREGAVCGRGAGVSAARTRASDCYTALMGASENGHLWVVPDLCQKPF